MKRHSALLGVLGLVSLGCGLNGGNDKTPSSDKARPKQARALMQARAEQMQQALAIAATRGARMADLEVVSQVTADDIVQMKVLDKKSRKIEAVSLDATGNEASPEQVAKTLERLRGRDFVGSVEAPLARKVAASPSSTFDAIVWTKTGDGAPKIDRKALESGKARAQVDALKAFHQTKTSAVKSFVEAQQGKVRYQSAYAPVVAVSVPGAMIAELAKREDVDVVYEALVYQPELDTSVKTIGVPFVWGKGIRGTGVPVAVVEGDGIYFGHDWLADGSYYNSLSPGIGIHATGVAGIIASTGTTYRGVAYGAPALLSANSGDYDDADIIAATDWAIGQGARAINFSFGVDSTSSMTGLDRYVDYITRYDAVTTVKSAGNTNTCPSAPHYVTSPGKGWNILTVGNFDNNNNTTLSDDIISSSSCYEDPDSPHGDRQKPEVAAPGTNITTTYCDGPSTCTGTNSGTSFAAPHVTGCAALLMERNPSLKYWPEPIRAVIMASAVENVEGDPRLSEKDGAGGVDCNYADQVLRGVMGTMSYGGYVASDFPQTYTFSANAGQDVRVVVAWDSNADTASPPTTDVLQADLDLAVYSPTSDYLGGSLSWDNAFEIVEFTAPVTGTYTATVNAFRFDGSSEYLGFAVWRGARKK